jgi:uncharacterized membrane protein
MNKDSISAVLRVLLKKILQNFLQGIVVLAPIGITLWVVLTLFNAVDDILPNILHVFFPDLLHKDEYGNLRKTPGLGFLVVIVIVVFVGRVSSSFIFTKLLHVLDSLLQKTPGIKFIYSSVKDFFEAFAGNKKKFDKPVLVNVDATDVWRVGFITQQDAKSLELDGHIVVYVPHSYAISGITYIVPKYRVKMLNNISASDAMKFVVSGGVTDIGGRSEVSTHIPE